MLPYYETAESRDYVDAPIDFIVPAAGPLFAYAHEPRPSDPPASIAFERHIIRIHDVRTEIRPSIDANGATLLNCPTEVCDFQDPDEIKRRYYPETATIIAAALGAPYVIVFDHNVRRGSGLSLKAEDMNQGRPVYHAHADYTHDSAFARARQLLGLNAHEFTHRRFVQINLWRPLRAPLRDAPLAFCDGATVAAADLRMVELHYPERMGEIYYLAYSPHQRWFFASDMDRHEAWLFKNFDSESARGARLAPHSAFDDPRSGQNAAPRESIEVRAFAFFGS